MGKKHILLVDGNSITHANHNGAVLTVGGMQVQAIFGVLKSLRALLQNTPGEKSLLVLWDGKAQFRLDLYPAYKGNRKPMDAKQEASRAAFKKQTPVLEAALSMLGIKQLRSPLLEADDLAGFIVPRLIKAGHRVTMVSGDKDWIQEVCEDCSWFDPIVGRRVDVDNFLDFTGYETPTAFVQGKALEGDNSDNVDGIAGMGAKGASLFLAKWKDVNNFFAAVDGNTHTPAVRKSKTSTSLHPEQVLASVEGRAIFNRNMKLMNWKQSRQPGPGELIHMPCEVQVDRFEHLCNRLAFASITREFDSFLRTFNITKEIA